MTHDPTPNTPRTPSKSTKPRRRIAAPKVLSPSFDHVSTPKTGRSCHKENPRSTNLRTKSSSRPSKQPVATENTSNSIRVQTSREIAELIALLRLARDMKVVEIPAGSKMDENSFGKLVKEKIPVVFRGYAQGWECTKKWRGTEYLMRAAEGEAEKFPHRKYRQFTAQSKENGRLHLTDGKSKARAVSMKEFLDNASQKEQDDGIYMLGIHARSGQSTLQYCPVQAHADDGGETPPLAADVPKDVDFLKWYAEIVQKEEKAEKPIHYDHQQFFLAKGYAFTDLHYDSYDNFYVAVTGTRRWTLACPSASRWLIDSSSGKLKSGSSAIPHLKSFPNGSPAQIYPFAYVDLYPGDLLYVPACWWHLVESKPGNDGFSSAFNFFFSKNPDRTFGEFQKRLKEADDLVNSLQSICRSRIAESCKSGTSTPERTSSELFEPPVALSNCWGKLVSLVKLHGIEEELNILKAKHECNSIELWVNHEKRSSLKEEPTGKTPKSSRKDPKRTGEVKNSA